MAQKTPELEKRTEAKNKRTINRLLNLYDMKLLAYSEKIQKAAQQQDDDNNAKADADILTEFKALVSIVEPLIKRWNIVHQGYDTNARIAEADAKVMLEKVEKKARESASPEDNMIQVAHYHPETGRLMAELPKWDSDEPNQPDPDQLTFDFETPDSE